MIGVHMSRAHDAAHARVTMFTAMPCAPPADSTCILAATRSTVRVDRLASDKDVGQIRAYLDAGIDIASGAC